MPHYPPLPPHYTPLKVEAVNVDGPCRVQREYMFTYALRLRSATNLCTAFGGQQACRGLSVHVPLACYKAKWV